MRRCAVALAADLVEQHLSAFALFRNVTPIVAPAARLNNVLLPVWLVVLGIALSREA
jgi:hypothetical protein